MPASRLGFLVKTFTHMMEKDHVHQTVRLRAVSVDRESDEGSMLLGSWGSVECTGNSTTLHRAPLKQCDGHMSNSSHSNLNSLKD